MRAKNRNYLDTFCLSAAHTSIHDKYDASYFGRNLLLLSASFVLPSTKTTGIGVTASQSPRAGLNISYSVPHTSQPINGQHCYRFTLHAFRFISCRLLGVNFLYCQSAFCEKTIKYSLYTAAQAK
jgi:hypothetical protein